MHLKKINLYPEKYPVNNLYPFNIEIFQKSTEFEFKTPFTFFVGENGSGKSTLLEAIALKCNINIWRSEERSRYVNNMYEKELQKYIEIEWTSQSVSGGFFAAEIFRYFAQMLDDWASVDPGQLNYFGGESLLTKSHGQCHMSFFKNRFKIKGLYFLDEPENALSPEKQFELLTLFNDFGKKGLAQFIICTHSPILLSLPSATIYSFDHIPAKIIDYEETQHYKVYKEFFSHYKSAKV